MTLILSPRVGDLVPSPSWSHNIGGAVGRYWMMAESESFSDGSFGDCLFTMDCLSSVTYIALESW